MRTFRLPLGIVAIAASFAVSSLAIGQRNVRRTAPRIRAFTGVPSAASPAPAHAVESNGRRCTVGCDDYSLAVVSAVLPSGTPGASSDIVTLVIENRGTGTAPASVISVAPRNRLSLARRSTIPTLAPGARATVQLPVEIGPDGTPCISITISPAPVEDPATARFLASAIPDPWLGFEDPGDWASYDNWTGFPLVTDAALLERLGELGDW